MMSRHRSVAALALAVTRGSSSGSHHQFRSSMHSSSRLLEYRIQLWTSTVTTIIITILTADRRCRIRSEASSLNSSQDGGHRHQSRVVTVSLVMINVMLVSSSSLIMILNRWNCDGALSNSERMNLRFTLRDGHYMVSEYLFTESNGASSKDTSRGCEREKKKNCFLVIGSRSI